MKHFIVFVAILLLLFLFLLDRSEEKEYQKPVMQSVVFNDRSYCNKVSELAFTEYWEKQCLLLGRTTDCDLPKSSHDQSVRRGEIVFHLCEIKFQK